MLEAPPKIMTDVDLPINNQNEHFLVVRKTTFSGKTRLHLDDLDQLSWDDAWSEACRVCDGGELTLNDDVIAIVQLNESGDLISSLNTGQLEMMIDAVNAQSEEECEAWDDLVKSESAQDRFVKFH